MKLLVQADFLSIKAHLLIEHINKKSIKVYIILGPISYQSQPFIICI